MLIRTRLIHLQTTDNEQCQMSINSLIAQRNLILVQHVLYLWWRCQQSTLTSHHIVCSISLSFQIESIIFICYIGLLGRTAMIQLITDDSHIIDSSQNEIYGPIYRQLRRTNSTETSVLSAERRSRLSFRHRVDYHSNITVYFAPFMSQNSQCLTLQFNVHRSC